jgi:creatinine amidohydrolase/Fe(II)-dependent formamide hydrolase-like protein
MVVYVAHSFAGYGVRRIYMLNTGISTLARSPPGIWGDSTLATRATGKIIVEARVRTILADIGALKTVTLPLAP